MKDDAVAPVIAVMLILAAVVTVFTIFNAIYIPSLKQAAETEHIQHVELSFHQFSSDIDSAVALHQDNLVFSEPVQLGGGDCLFNTLKSGGSLSVENEPKPVYNLTFTNTSGALLREVNGTLATVAYTSSGNFWQDQGYRWQRGYLNVTKYGTRQVPLSYYNMTDVTNAFGNNRSSLYAFAGSFGHSEYSSNQTLFQNMTPTADNRFVFSRWSGNCSNLDLRAVNLSADPDHWFASGNGIGRLDLTTHVASEQIYNVRTITMYSDGSAFGNATVWKWNESLTSATVSTTCGSNIVYNPDPAWSGDGHHTYNLIQQTSPVNVTLTTVRIVIGAV